MTKEYRIARKLLQGARRVILAGYSFGNMDDWNAYEAITSAIRSRRLATVVAKPEAYDLALRISDDGASSTVVALSVYWDKLTMAIIASVGEPRYKTCHHMRLCIRCISYLYNAFLDRRRLLEIDFVKRETFAYVCEAYSRILELSDDPRARGMLLDEHLKGPMPAEECVDASEYIDILCEAVAARNGWKRILERCSPPRQTRRRGLGTA